MDAAVKWIDGTSSSGQKIWKYLREGEINKAEQILDAKLVSLEERNEAGKSLLMVPINHALLESSNI